MSRHSRLQKQVLSLYRELLRAARGKPGAEARVRAEFREQAGLQRTDVLRIEYLYRRGRRQLEQLRDSHTTGMGVFVPGASPRPPNRDPDPDPDPGLQPKPGAGPKER
ncbi:succinate dehydrogenase assembly factor 1, mitochondrial [Phascolarctos cinereus]|uniref:Succinate dehydrogenase assembly factor 1, mitochondrial n=1 Tax=Phascolarctos cinereus TaxID=38626 RepID=A0A6P5JJR8_PHACI|nr:succinate dehydrogenase assembly factor 1, mitochondrial [Phascolarctos cinereus]